MPEITAGFAFRPDTAKPMRELAHILLHTSGKNGFSSRDREIVAVWPLREMHVTSVKRATVPRPAKPNPCN
jgi:hypothetical protein